MADTPAPERFDRTGELVPGGIALGRYQLLRKLARGGMAEVFLARSHGAHGFEKTVAIKRILPKYGNDEHFVRMMVDEAKISVLLNHPNICQILEFGEQGGTHFIVMEYVPGQALSALMKRMAQQGKRLGPLEACYICVELLQGLHAAHVQTDNEGRPANIIHRDVSPQNLLLSYDGHVKIIDFGIARAKNRLEHTEIGTIKGKLRYLAPEMIDPSRYDGGDFDHRVDVWAAGVVLHELIAWRKLFIGSNDVAVYEAIVEGEIPDLIPEGTDPALMAIINKGLQRNPKHRYQTAEAFADDLRAYLYSNDPGFTAKRVSKVLEEFFGEEKAKLLELEEPDPDLAQGGELNLTASHQVGALGSSPSSSNRGDDQSASRARAGNMAMTSAERSRPGKSGSRSQLSAANAPPVGPSIADALGNQAPANAKTQVVDPEMLRAQEEAARAAAAASAQTNGAPPPGNLAAHHQAIGVDDVTRLSNPESTTKLEDGSDRSLTSVDETSDTGATREHVPVQPKRMSPLVPLGLAAILGVFVCVFAIVLYQIFKEKPATDVVQTTPTPAVATPETKAPEGTPSPSVAPPTGAEIPVLIASNPPGATVEVDGEAGTKRTPSVFMVKPGRRMLVAITLDGYERYQETVSVQAGDEQLKVQADLSPKPVEFSVKAKPSNAKILVDGKRYRGPMSIRPGVQLKVTASADGYVSQTKRVEAHVGGGLEVRFDLDKVKKIKKKEPQAKRGKGTLIVTTSGKWGRVTIDGVVQKDTTPVRVKLSAGSHTVEVAHPPEGKVKTFKVKIEPGQSIRKTVKF